MAIFINCWIWLIWQWRPIDPPALLKPKPVPWDKMVDMRGMYDLGGYFAPLGPKLACHPVMWPVVEYAEYNKIIPTDCLFHDNSNWTRVPVEK